MIRFLGQTLSGSWLFAFKGMVYSINSTECSTWLEAKRLICKRCR